MIIRRLDTITIDLWFVRHKHLISCISYSRLENYCCLH